MLKQEKELVNFDWSMIGNIDEGRPNLGPYAHLATYRLMQYSIRSVLITQYGEDQANQILFQAGELVGKEFYQNIIKHKNNTNDFISDLIENFKTLGMGIIRIEKTDLENFHIILVVEEDLDCSGLPLYNKSVCTYDEGFIAGILNAHFKIKFDVKEIDCWCSGERVCRFEIKPFKN